MLELTTRHIHEDTIGTLVLLVCENRGLYEDEKVVSLIQTAKKMDAFKGAKKQCLIMHHPIGFPIARVVFMGIGKHKEIDHESLRSAAGRSVVKAMESQLSRINILVPSGDKLKMPLEDVLESLLEGACLANHRFNQYKTAPRELPLKHIKFLMASGEVRRFKQLPPKIETLCKGTHLAREWVSMPSNDKRPEVFAKIIATAAKREKLAVTVWNQKMLQQEKFGALMAVAAGSEHGPRMVELRYKAPKATQTIALVGKGVTFDSGGLNLKTSAGIGTMKIDMAGAAAVAATLITAARLKPAVNLIGLLPIVENMPSGRAYRPGDVVTSFTGKTIEIGNTDAEGRLILADALAYAVKAYQPDILIDLATLTGACMVALGDRIAGVFSRDNALAKAIVTAGEQTFERCWQMPLPNDYKELMKSDLADIQNMSRSKYGGAITAALFLSEFVGKTRWAHVDIAGPALNEKPGDYCPVGGKAVSGFGVRLLMKAVTSILR